MPNSEGEILKNRFKGTGKAMKEIAGILGMTRQNLNVHLKKEILGDDFKRLIADKGKLIFHVEHLDKRERAGKVIGGMAEDLLYLKASDKIQGQIICKILAKINKTTLEHEVEELEKNVSEEVDRLFAEYERR